MDDWTQFLFTVFALAVVSAMIWGFYPIFAPPAFNQYFHVTPAFEISKYGKRLPSNTAYVKTTA